jgi:hypothetical protein
MEVTKWLKPSIPVRAWAMMALMAISCNLLVGYGERRKGELFLFVLPVVVSLAFSLIADLDNPRGAVIRCASTEPSGGIAIPEVKLIEGRTC